jgi:hypothetical protein
MTNKETANHIRASVINCCLDVEDAITLTHGHWYSKSREDGVLSTNRLVIDLLADLGFEKKINLYIGFVKEFPNEFSKSMIKDLNEIRSVRNQLAHRIYIDPSDPVAPGDELLIMKPGEFIFDKIGKQMFSFNLDQLQVYQKVYFETMCEIFSKTEIISRRLRNTK